MKKLGRANKIIAGLAGEKTRWTQTVERLTEDYGYIMNGGTPGKNSQRGFKEGNVAWSQDMFEPLERVFTKPEKPILFEDGVGSVIESKNKNMHVFPILRASPGCFSFNKGADDRK